MKKIIIAGPCSVESKKQIEEISNFLFKYKIKYLRGGCFKPRTDPKSFQGLRDFGIDLLYNCSRKNNQKTVTEVLSIDQLKRNYDKIDVIQIGSRNMTNFELLKEVGKITKKDKKQILLKRGFSSTISEFLKAGEYIEQFGNKNIWYCLRGIRTFEQIDSDQKFTSDLSSILELKKYNKKILFDPSHSTGNSRYVVDISKAALLLGADGLIIEVHNNPKKARSDKNQQLTFKEFEKLLNEINCFCK
jgi:3-deoxy-7-phosphoheptulonate synthase